MTAGRELRIVHLTVYRDLPAGVRKQLRYEYEASGRIEGARWTTLAIHKGHIAEPFEHAIPSPFRPVMLRSLYGWIIAMRLSREYDFVLMRHMVFDPFAFLFAPLVQNRIGVHHSKEVEELPLIRPGLRGKLAAAMERFAGGYSVRHSAGILGVTTEISQYERETRAPGKPIGFYPNGICLESVELAPDERSSTGVTAVFICETFSQWHGLDRLVDAVADAEHVPDGLAIHLIGKLSVKQRAQIDALGDRRSAFHIHGFLEAAAYCELLGRADVGLGSLAMDRQNMQEGTTLKVREMLGMGLPVFSGHRDSALPDSFPYYAGRNVMKLADLYNFARSMKGVSRATVRDAAVPFIEKRSAMQEVINWLGATFPGGIKRPKRH